MSTVELAPYQIEAFNFLSNNERAGLWDWPGVGKSYPAIEALYHNSNESWVKPDLVVSPKHLVPNWKHYMAQYGLPAIELHADIPVPTEDYIGLCSYEHVTKYIKELFGDDRDGNNWYGTLICDESHYLKNGRTKRAKAIDSLSEICGNFYQLTGTPVTRSASDLYNQLYLMDPKRFPNYYKFINYWCVIQETPFGIKPLHIKKKRRKELQELLKNYVLRRRFSDIPELSQLKHSVEPIYVELKEDVLKKYRRVYNQWKYEFEEEYHEITGGGARTFYLRKFLYQVDHSEALNLNNYKSDFLKEFQKAQSAPFIVFTKYIEAAKLAAKALNTPFILTGETPADKRYELIQNWKIESSKPLHDRNPVNIPLVATIGSVGQGLNLQYASTCVFYEFDYSAAMNTQAIGRLLRRGQENPVNAYFLITKDTIEEDIYDKYLSRIRADKEFDEILNAAN